MKHDDTAAFSTPLLAALCLPLMGLLLLQPAVAQTTTYTENFTGATTTNSWYFINGACLTAGSTAPASTVSPGQVPACVTNGVILPYYPKADLSLVGGNTGTLPDIATTGGALRFTNGAPYGYNENGAILSAFNFPTTNGIQITFTTETYEGNSGGSGKDGADGISFFLQDVDQGQVADIGDYGGSLGYSCSNSNNDAALRASGQPRGYDGLIGGYIGLGIDEYGNFLNSGDNTSSGQAALSAYVGSGDYQPNRIGLRGAGSTAWSYLNATYASYYPATLTNAQRASAVQQACTNGYVYDWSAVGTWNTTGRVNGTTTTTQPTPTSHTATQLANYAAIPNGFKVLGSTLTIANESALYRGAGTTNTSGTSYGVPISYNLTITPAGLLSMSYSYNGGVYQPVITGQDITQANGPLPNAVRFGFAGSTGGSTNVHEIMCFQAAPQSESGTSAGINQKQSAKVLTGTQVYFAYYNTNDWPGSLTSQYIEVDPANPSDLIYAPVANWDASCVLSGIATGATCAATGVSGLVAPQAPTARTILTWNGTTGVGFEWSNLTSAQQALLDPSGTSAAPNELNYLRGVRSNEINSVGVGLYRARASVLGDIIDSSPTFVGPPSQGYTAAWTDLLDAGTAPTPPENAGSAQTYPAFVSAEQTRTNVVYAGANDGLLHGFRSGSYTSATAYNTADNDGLEVLAYMPGFIVNAINSATNVSNDYSNLQYAHHFDVDATPATGDLFYGNQWHTWLVGGLGPGGNAIYALDITNPGVAGAANFSENAGPASTTVIGEWSTKSTTTSGVTTTTSTFTCTGSTANASTSAAACGNNLGKTYGTPEVRRFHNGSWGFVFGNGYNSSTGDAGIYVGLVNSTTGAVTMYYLSAGQSGKANGIYYPSALDIDGDSIVDYIYAGDLLGNVWRFDVTSISPSQWTVGTTALYSPAAGAAQPITTKPLAFLLTTGVLTRVMVEFGTGQEIPQTNSSAAIYSTTQQALYGIWDWNMGVWNAKSAFPVETVSTGGAAPITAANLQAQTITASYNAALSGSGTAFRTVSTHAVCYADVSGCSQYGWYLNLSVGPASSAVGAPTVYEQLLYTPALLSGVFIVNSTIPPTSTLTTCSATPLSAWTIAIDPATGGALTDAFFQYANGNYINVTSTTAGETATQGVSSVSDLGIGTPTSVTYNGQMFVISSPLPPGASPPPAGMLPSGSAAPFLGHGKPPSVKRWSWVERR